MRPFDELSAHGRATRLRAVAIEALDGFAVHAIRLRLLSNDFNCIFRVDTVERPFALRISLPRRADAELRAELVWLSAVADDGRVRAPKPIPTVSGEAWAVVRAAGVPGARRCALFSWLPGRAMRPFDVGPFFEAFGAAAASLHDHARRSPTPAGVRAWKEPFPFPDEPPILFEQPVSATDRSIWSDSHAAAVEALTTVERSGQRAILTHHDLHIDNVRVFRGQLAILDFDDCMLAHPAQDLGVSVFQNRMRGCGDLQLAAFRAGYERNRRWPEPGLVERFVAASAMILANAVYQDFDPAYRTAAKDYEH